jgi:hypothetical protein
MKKNKYTPPQESRNKIKTKLKPGDIIEWDIRDKLLKPGDIIEWDITILKI